MSKVKLILSNSPSIQTPVKFFITAILFAIVAAIIALWQGHTAFISRWSSATLAITHILVLGYAGLIMQGALLQIVSVVLGKQPPYVERLAIPIHLFLTLGVAFLAWGFLTFNSELLFFSALLIVLSFVTFIISLLISIVKRKARSDTGFGIAMAIFSLIITLALGVWLVLAYTSESISLNRQLTTIHLSWGLLGWVGILVFTIAYEVVPMFQLTKNYPAIITKWLGLMLLIGLFSYSSGLFFSLEIVSLIGRIVIAISLSLFACITLWLQYKRKKKQSDPTLWFWRIGMVFLLLTILLWSIGQFEVEIAKSTTYPISLGVLMIVGFILSIINGMLYKIIPFLVWLHLSILVGNYKVSRRLIPNIKTMLSIPMAYMQLGLHLLAIILMISWIAWSPTFFVPATLSFAVSNIVLLANLSAILIIYKKTRSEILSLAANQDS